MFKLSILFLFFANFVFAQSEIEEIEIKLKENFQKIINSKVDADKIIINNQIIEDLTVALNIDGSFDYKFDSLIKLGKLVSEDNIFKIYNWNIPLENNRHIYNAILQVWNVKEQKYDIVFLSDKSKDIPNPEKSTLTKNSWFGALYYQIVICKHKKQKYYLLIGWQGVDYSISRKVIEVLEIDDDGTLTFGKSVFKFDDEKKKRIIFEFSAKTSMVCRYDSKYDLIIFDHLSPSKSIYHGQYQYYGPDMSQDTFEYKNGKWFYKANFDARNPKPIKVKTKVKQ